MECTGLNIPFDKIKQKQYYDADGFPIPESDLVRNPHIGHSTDRDNFIRMNFGQEHLDSMYADSTWVIDDIKHIQGYPLFAKWMKHKGHCHASCKC